MTMISLIIFAILFTFASSSNEGNIIKITNSGSTNTAGYVIELQRNGHVKWTVARRRVFIDPTTPSSTTGQNSIQLPSLRTNAIFQAAEDASPFNQYPHSSCGKSVSFGTTLYVTYNGQETPDISCPIKDAKLALFSEKIHELISDLNINTFG